MTHRTQSKLMAIAAGVIFAASVVWLLSPASGAIMALPPNSGVSAAQSKWLQKVYGDAARKMKKVVLNPSGATEASKDFYRLRAAQLNRQIDDIRQELGAKASLWIGENVPAAYRVGLVDGDRQAVELGVRDARSGMLVRGDFALIDRDAIETLARDSAGDLFKAADSMAKQAKSVLRQTAQRGLSESDLNQILARGIIVGQPRETFQLLRDALVKVHGETVQAGSRNYPADYYAEMVARTKTREAVVTGRHTRFRQVGIDLVRIIGRETVNFCTEFLHRVYSLSGEDETYPAYAELPNGGPPFHPFCSKSTVAFVPAMATPKQIEDSLPDEEKAAA